MSIACVPWLCHHTLLREAALPIAANKNKVYSRERAPFLVQALRVYLRLRLAPMIWVYSIIIKRNALNINLLNTMRHISDILSSIIDNDDDIFCIEDEYDRINDEFYSEEVRNG
jgi:hypothetical protein